MYPLLQNIPDDIRALYMEVDALPEPIIGRQHRITFSVHDTLRDMGPVTEFTSVSFLQGAGPVTSLPQKGRLPNR